MTDSTGSSRAVWSPGEPTPPGPATVAGDITALNPTDGLFLRAEHLRTIETYARSLTLALGTGVGAGVVHGFELSLDVDQTSLQVRPGLAVNPVGQPLRAMSPLTVPLDLDDLEGVGPNGFWVVEVTPAWWPFGDDKVFGNLCDDPCDGSSSIRPWIAEGVTVRLRGDDMPGLAGVGSGRRRNWLASAYFERERSIGDPWLTPANGPSAVPPLWTRDWSTGPGQPQGTAVPIGVLQLADGAWVLDTWTARRDVGGEGPADRAWRGRLSMRPWNVYVAHILQFQDSIAPQLSAEPVLKKHAVVDERHERIDEFIARMQTTPVGNWHDFKEFVAAYTSGAAPYVLASDELSLRDRGFDELPPAGFLPIRGDQEMGRARLTRLFGDRIDLRVCSARADAVVTAVEEARHLDRIPLASDLVDQVGVDILVPDLPADLSGTSSDDYGWVAFVRRRLLSCGEEQTQPDSDTVPVHGYYILDWSDEIAPEVARLVEDGKLGDDSLLGELVYPADSWEYPGGDVAVLAQESNRVLGIVALATEAARVPLMALRGHLFAASLSDQSDHVPVVAVEVSGAEHEVIIVVLQVVLL